MCFSADGVSRYCVWNVKKFHQSPRLEESILSLLSFSSTLSVISFFALDFPEHTNVVSPIQVMQRRSFLEIPFRNAILAVLFCERARLVNADNGGCRRRTNESMSNRYLAPIPGLNYSRVELSSDATFVQKKRAIYRVVQSRTYIHTYRVVRCVRKKNLHGNTDAR